MAEMISVREAAVRWNITERRVATLCKNGRIAGAKKQGNRWLIPADTQKPADQRLKTGAFRKTERAPKLPLPIGVSNYCLASSEYYYIDKTMMIKDFIDERPMVTLFTRPRRFGKTLNMDMLRTYFEKNDKDTSVYFQDKKIWACGQKYRDYQGKYPVIFLTFKDVKFDTWEETFAAIRDIFAKETRRHKELLASDKCDEYSKKTYEKLADGKVSEVELASALLDLSAMLHKHYAVAPIIIIDEYDTPIQQGYQKDYYDKVIRFMRNLFSGGFKDNQHLSFGFLTGILRVAKESIFSGMNNLSINSVLDNKYSAYFGFTADEVMEMAEYYGAADKFDEICQWYDGYRFGKTEIFNPWSVVNYFSNECEPRPFWVSTGSNDIIGEVLAQADEEIYNRLTSLVNGETFTTFIDIQGVEDFHGEMDFKVAGTKKGITAIQMDLKNDGLTMEIIKNALDITYDARCQILDQIMLPCIAEPRPEVSKYAPKMITLHIDPDKIREVIGKGGSVIQKIVAESGAKIDIDDDGTIHIASPDADSCAIAKKCIDDIVFVPEVGQLYYGRVVRLMTFGAFVELAPGKDGLVHISKLADKRIEKVEDACKVGDMMWVKVTEIDEKGRVNLSRKDALKEMAAKQ